MGRATNDVLLALLRGGPAHAGRAEVIVAPMQCHRQHGCHDPRPRAPLEAWRRTLYPRAGSRPSSPRTVEAAIAAASAGSPRSIATSSTGTTNGWTWIDIVAHVIHAK